MKKISYCEKCQRQVQYINRIYSPIYHGYICLNCYHNQTPKIPSHPKPLCIAGYYKHDYLLEP